MIKGTNLVKSGPGSVDCLLVSSTTRVTEDIGRHERGFHGDVGRSAYDPFVTAQLSHRKSTLTIDR